MRTNIARRVQNALIDDNAARDKRLHELVGNELDGTTYRALWCRVDLFFVGVAIPLSRPATMKIYMRSSEGYEHRRGSSRWLFYLDFRIEMNTSKTP